jgi:hypothetical protein
MNSSRLRKFARQRSPATHGRRSPPPHTVAVSLLTNIVTDPAHVAAALCQMATLAHVAGHASKRNESVGAAAELLAHREYLSRRAKRPILTNPLPC